MTKRQKEPDYSDDPDYTDEVGEVIGILDPGGRAFRSYELLVDLTLADTLERVAVMRGNRPEELAAELLSQSLDLLHRALAPAWAERAAVADLADAVSRTLEAGAPAEGLTQALAALERARETVET